MAAVVRFSPSDSLFNHCNRVAVFVFSLIELWLWLLLFLTLLIHHILKIALTFGINLSELPSGIDFRRGLLLQDY